MNDNLYEKLMTYFDGEMSSEERVRFEAYLSESKECREALDRLEQGRRTIQRLKSTPEADEFFTNRVINRIEEMQKPREQAEPLPDFLRWLLPSLGYALSAILVFLTFSAKHPAVVNAETILLSDVPHETRSVFVKSGLDVSPIFATEEM